MTDIRDTEKGKDLSVEGLSSRVREIEDLKNRAVTLIQSADALIASTGISGACVDMVNALSDAVEKGTETRAGLGSFLSPGQRVAIENAVIDSLELIVRIGKHFANELEKDGD